MKLLLPMCSIILSFGKEGTSLILKEVSMASIKAFSVIINTPPMSTRIASILESILFRTFQLLHNESKGNTKILTSFPT